MKREQRRERALALCKEIGDLDDQFAKFCDGEGDLNGPTWHAFKEGYLARRALRAIELHRKAIAVWGQLYNLARHKTRDAVEK